ncbi:MAG TPA: secondary thiamine-phosphate synthase enzyme YjbQ [Candidatus Nanoarchaeia archaeon]|nr:secondary thiamine-phosphate synthase enzyme YjbQ [Candidatus Nanoarchaeia archaeon]
MKSHTEYLEFNTSKRIEFVNITNKVEQAVKKSVVKEGLVLINAMHITASVFVNDEEPGLKSDYIEWLHKLVDTKKDYKHNLTGEDNAYAHLMRTVMGREVVVAITNGKLDLGPWEQIFYLELDGQRKKRVMVKIIGE